MTERRARAGPSEKRAQNRANGCGRTTETVKSRLSCVQIPCPPAIWGQEFLAFRTVGGRVWLGEGANGQSGITAQREMS